MTWVEYTKNFLWTVFALLLAATGVRFFWLALDLREVDVALPELLPKRTGLSLEELLPLLTARTDPSALSPPLPSSGEEQPLRATVFVGVEPPRSEVYLDGVYVGKTPYIGHKLCQRGEWVKVEVLPPRSAPIRNLVRCSADIRISR